MTFPMSLQAARLALLRPDGPAPYLASAIWALRPVERIGLGTLAVDQWWRLYYDPVISWSVAQCGAVLEHEVWHLLRDHAGRRAALAADPGAFNLAADAEINDDAGLSKRLPPGHVTPQSLGQPPHRLAEEYYAALTAPKPVPESPSSGAGAGTPDAPSGATNDPGTSQAAGDEDPDGDGPAAGAGDGAESGDGAERGQGQGDGAEGGSDGASGGDDGADPASVGGGASGDGTGSGPASTSSGPSSSSGGGATTSPSDSSSGPASSGSMGPGDATEHGTGTRSASGEGEQPSPGAGRCGSCATGRREPWEIDGPGDDGIGHAEAGLIARSVAQAVASRGIGVGDAIRQWAAGVLAPPVIDWRRELAAIVRGELSASGAGDYTYARPARWQMPGLVRPALRARRPQTAVVVDTSGSMSDALVADALAETEGILRHAGAERTRIIACDYAATVCRRVTRTAGLVLPGCGGTDMGVGIAAAEKLHPRPDVVVVITDGYTPWPTTPPRARVVVVIVGQGASKEAGGPNWAKVIRAEEKP